MTNRNSSRVLNSRAAFEPVQNLEPRIVLDGDWSAAEGAGVFGSWGDGGYLTVTTIDLHDEPIVFEQVSRSGDDDGGAIAWQQIALLTTDDGQLAQAALGRRSIAVHDDRLLIGAPGAAGGDGAAAVFRYQRATGAWAFETLLTAPAGSGDGFGWAVDIHGNTAVIGSRSGDAAWVFRDSGAWTLQATLQGDDPGGRFGFSVATDGSTVAVGAPGEERLDDDAARTSGAVYIFERDSGAWDLSTRMDAPVSALDSEFGHAVAVHSGSVIVGAWLDDDMGAESGSVFAIGRDREGWGVEAKITPSGDAPGARFGAAVAASGSRAAALAIGSDDGSALPWAQVLKRRGDRWSVEATLAPAGSAGDDLGYRSIAFHGDRVALGTDAGGGGAALYRKAEGTDRWLLEATLAPAQAAGAEDVGAGVAIHDATVLVGGGIVATSDGGAAASDAAVWVFGPGSGSGAPSGGNGPGSFGPGDDDEDDDDGGHDQNDDHGKGDDDGAGHDQNDDHGNGHDDGAGHDQNDDHGNGDSDDDGFARRSGWIVRSLGTLPGVGSPLSDLLTWTDPKDGRTYAAVATAEGLMLFVRGADRAGWAVRNLTAETANAAPVSGQISVFGTRAGIVHIVGSTASGDLVVYRQSGAGSAGAYAWEFENISEEHLRPRGFATPAFSGKLVTFVTSWNALNIAGLDDNGRIQAVWTTPGMGHWRSDDLSAMSGAPAISGKLAVFLTSWGGINLAGTDAEGALAVTWWVPGFERWTVSDFNALFGGPTIDSASVSAFVTPWGALNITGRDDRGDLVAYWWTPAFGERRDDDYWRVSNLTEQIVGSEQPGGELQGLVTPDGTINLFGTNALNDVVRYFWEPGEHWKMENLTHIATPV